ncbi:MAG: thiosulfate oxidation carrier protein SoxY [Betaproteobacteria bacterium]|nr:thiosulfate oxidation carrier protein SoxY [Betaproteobacteria bacterium]MDE2358883.1 thiosulfate oxidation carrier protein SoxY [Betaproteobacteria bacterium]
MDMDRRQVLKTSGGATFLALLAAAGWIPPAHADAPGWNKSEFDTHTMDATLAALGAGKPATSSDVAFFSTPDIAENGAVVPIGVTSKLPNTESIAILVEKNPFTLAALFDLPAGTEPTISTRVKMRETSNVYALVKAGGKYFMTSKEIKVTLGGCGG